MATLLLHYKYYPTTKDPGRWKWYKLEVSSTNNEGSMREEWYKLVVSSNTRKLAGVYRVIPAKQIITSGWIKRAKTGHTRRQLVLLTKPLREPDSVGLPCKNFSSGKFTLFFASPLPTEAGEEACFTFVSFSIVPVCGEWWAASLRPFTRMR